MFDSLTFRVTLGKLQAYCLGHVRIEAYTLLQFLRFLSYIKKFAIVGLRVWLFGDDFMIKVHV